MKNYILFFVLYSSINIFYLNCSFQSKIFTEINENNIGKNIIISPLSIFQILSLTANGARNTTLKSMVDTLGSKDINSLNQINYDILDSFSKFTSLEIANAIMTRFTPEPDFVKVSKNYLATVEPLLSVNQVNDWCSNKTHGKIKSILQKLDPNLEMLLLNAVYFKGDWVHKFEDYNTRDRTFYNFNKEEIKVKMMGQTSRFNYYEDEEIQVVELPFKKDNVSALVILPNKNIDINEYINSFNTNEDFDLQLNDIIMQMENVKVSLNLPKFKVTFGETLNKYLESMGMSIAFRSGADFSGMTEKQKLFIGSVVHKTYLDVNEAGVEAAAVTAISMVGSGLPRPEKIYSMNVERPFLFLLMTKGANIPKQNNLLFMAKIEEL